MPTVLLRWPGRRCHATPWGHHVNEGLIEWPPSPWRLLRALLSVGYTACGWPADPSEPWGSSPPPAARRLFERLASVAPSYALPAATAAHTRHYMPTAEFKGGQERTTMVFDTWAQIESGELAIHWDVSLDDEALAVLTALVERLNYLGRSESWVQARLAADPEAQRIKFDCLPKTASDPLAPGWEQIALLSPLPPPRYANWRQTAADQALAEPALQPLSTAVGKAAVKAAAKLQAERETRLSMYPKDTLACLQVDTSFLRQHGWSQPPGTQKLIYWRRSDALQAAATAGVSGHAGGQASPVTAVLLALATQSLNSHALPILARTLRQAEMLHRQVLGAFGRLGPAQHSPVLSGCDEEGQPLRGAHQHAHLLPLDLDGDGHIDHILVWAPAGLPDQEQRALRQTRNTYTRGGVGALRLAWVGSGQLADLMSMNPPQGSAIRRNAGASRHWVSATPFVPPRHLKRSGTNTLPGQVAAELASRGMPPPLTVDWLDPREHERARALRHVAKVRRFGPPPPVDQGFVLRLAFAEPLAGPLCLGYGSHFGLGRFEHSADEAGVRPIAGTVTQVVPPTPSPS